MPYGVSATRSSGCACSAYLCHFFLSSAAAGSVWLVSPGAGVFVISRLLAGCLLPHEHQRTACSTIDGSITFTYACRYALLCIEHRNQWFCTPALTLHSPAELQPYLGPDVAAQALHRHEVGVRRVPLVLDGPLPLGPLLLQAPALPVGQMIGFRTENQ